MKNQGKNNPNYKHGLNGTKEYILWINIKERCFNTKHIMYKYYGGRGIKMYKLWIKKPIDFISYVKSLPDYGLENYSLDRIDNDGNYEPNNLRWVDKTIQCINQKNRINISGYKGICWHKGNKKWMSYISYYKIKKHLGYFNTLEDAVKARNQYIIDHNLPHPIQSIS